MPVQFEILRVKDLREGAVVRLSGSIDPLCLAPLQQSLEEAIDLGRRILILDLAEVRYINSAGLAYLVNLTDKLQRRRGALLLANPSPKVKIVFDLMGVSRFFKVFKTVDAALGAVATARRARPPKPAVAKLRKHA